jgi:hypothetical protein
MVRDDLIEVVQRGEVVDIDERDIESIRGPIRLRIRPRALESALDNLGEEREPEDSDLD